MFLSDKYSECREDHWRWLHILHMDVVAIIKDKKYDGEEATGINKGIKWSS